jgi:phospholipid/cholesterol/gamma-HCH transport system substrate-binding protein
MGLAVQNDRLATRVGGVVIVLVIIAGVLLVQLGNVQLGSFIKVTVFFEHTGALREGNAVTVAGREVGRVAAIRLVPDQLAPEGHPLHGTGGVAVDLRIRKKLARMIPVNGDFFVNSKGLLGGRYLEVGPPPGDALWARTVVDGDQVRGIDPPRMDRVMQRSFANLMNTRMFLDAVTPEGRKLMRALDELGETLELVEPEPGAYAAAGASFARVGDELAELRAAWTGAVDLDQAMGIAERAGLTIDAARVAIAGVRARVDRLEAEVDRIAASIPADTRQRFERAIEAARTATAKIDGILAETRALVAIYERGEGTIGALLNDPEFADDAKQLGIMIRSNPWRLVGRPPPEGLPF